MWRLACALLILGALLSWTGCFRACLGTGSDSCPPIGCFGALSHYIFCSLAASLRCVVKGLRVVCETKSQYANTEVPERWTLERHGCTSSRRKLLGRLFCHVFVGAPAVRLPGECPSAAAPAVGPRAAAGVVWFRPPLVWFSIRAVLVFSLMQLRRASGQCLLW